MASLVVDDTEVSWLIFNFSIPWLLGSIQWVDAIAMFGVSDLIPGWLSLLLVKLGVGVLCGQFENMSGSRF